ncbi:cytochrome c family protein [Halofilum ochraceum]|uniref:cytochrome c family protein n=1 Tax=Halofilum ochraceum TaxID=1611323 RepID=UPI0011130A17|nr:cytochrome c family protein [Halofilum ochraceum]
MVSERSKSARRYALPLILGLWAIAGSASAVEPGERDPARVVGPQECAECHENATAIWRNTHHFSTFREMPRKKEAIEIARNMGLRRIKEDSLCLDCHFTSKLDEEGKPEPIAGISCESCHGAGQGYLEVHSEFSGKEEEEETEAEEKARWQKAEEGGMIRPHMMYTWAKNCYSCHVVPEEKLVNKGGHPAGSPFELVAWSQGEVRHNVWYNEGESNPPADTERRRKMFIVGMAVELESALRAVGNATEKADYAVTMAKRAQRARKRFAQAAQLVEGVPEMGEITSIAKDAQLKLNNKGPLTEAADRIGDLTQQIVAEYDGSGMGGIDPALPGEGDWKGSPERE